MPTPTTTPGTFRQRIFLVVASPVIFLLVSDVVIYLAGINTEVARNENFEIGVPVWLLDDENWADIQRGRLEPPRGVRAEDIACLQYFEEARHIEYKLKPNIEVDANNPFNDIELRK